MLYMNLLTSGKLHSYLAEVDKQAEDMFLRLVKEYADRQGVTEQLKAENPHEWIGRMNKHSGMCEGSCWKGAYLHISRFEVRCSRRLQECSYPSIWCRKIVIRERVDV